MATYDTVWYTSSVGYAAVTAWAALNVQHCGDMVRQLAAPAVGSERCFVCIASTSGTGATGASEPAGASWTGATRGQKTTDATVTWMEATGIAALNGDITNTPIWSNSNIKNKAISIGQVISNVAGTLLLICTTAGTTGNGAEPSWAAFTNAGATTVDNGATWTTLGAPGNYAAWAHPHARIRNACSTTSTWGVDGNLFFIADNHAETQSTTMNWGNPSGTYVMSYIISIDHTLSLPPSDSTYKAGASITTTGTMNFIPSAFYLKGITLVDGTGAGGPAFGICNTSKSILFLENCTLSIPGTGGSVINFGNVSTNFGNKFRFNNVVINMGSGALLNFFGTDLEWINTPSAITGTMPTTLFGGSGVTSIGSYLVLKGVDLNNLGSGKTIVGQTTSTDFKIKLIDCKLNSAVTLCTLYPNTPSQYADFIRCDSSGTNYSVNRFAYNGIQAHELTAIRTGGASDGTTGVSHKIATSSNVALSWANPFEALPIPKWNAVTAGNVVVTVYGITTQAALPNLDDIWIEVEYLGNSGSPLAAFVNSTKTSILSASTGLSADTASAWGAGAAAYQQSHAYGAFTGFILAGNASPQQLWFMSAHSGTGTSGSSSTIFNGQADGAQVTDNAGANQIIWQAVTRFSMSVTLGVTNSCPQPQLAGYLQTIIKAAKPSTTFYIDPLVVLS